MEILDQVKLQAAERVAQHHNAHRTIRRMRPYGRQHRGNKRETRERHDRPAERLDRAARFPI